MNMSQDYFENVFVGSTIKYVCILISAAISSLVLILFTFIMWYERFGSSNQRNILSRLFSSYCFMCIEWFTVCQVLDYLRYVYGPMPYSLCMFYLAFKNAVAMQIFIYFGIVAIFRWFLIFKVKNLQGFHDEFWTLFSYIWTFASSGLCQLVFVLLPGRQPVIFYICHGKMPEMHLSPKFNPTVTLLPLASLFLQLVIQWKIYKYKKTEVRIPIVVRYTRNYTPDTDAISKFSGRFFNFLTFSLAGFAIYKIHSIPPEEIKNYPSSLYIHLIFLVIPPVVGSFGFIYVLMNKSLQRAIKSEMMNFRIYSIH